MSEEDSEKSFDANWRTWLIYINGFAQTIDNLVAEGCVSESLAIETKKKIAEASELITKAVEDNDKDKKIKAKDLVQAIVKTFFGMLDSCYNKYVSSRVR